MYVQRVGEANWEEGRLNRMEIANPHSISETFGTYQSGRKSTNKYHRTGGARALDLVGLNCLHISVACQLFLALRSQDAYSFPHLLKYFSTPNVARE